MLENLLNGGPFMMVLFLLVGGIIFISVKNITSSFWFLKNKILLLKFAVWSLLFEFKIFLS